MKIMSSKALVFSVIVLFVGAGVVPSISSDEPVSRGTIYVDDDASPGWYDATHVKTIQEGIDNATVGDTVYVYNGTYYERFELYTQVDLIGENKNSTIIDGCENNPAYGWIIEIHCNGVTISGFTIKNSTGNLISVGVHIRSNNNNISNNIIISNGDFGIWIFDHDEDWDPIITKNNIIKNNIISDHEETGLYLSHSKMNTIANNTFLNDGLMVYESINNTVDNNTVNGKPLVFLNEKSNITIDEAGQVILIDCNNLTIQNQNLSNTDCGIYLLDSTNCSIVNNTLSNVFFGLMLVNSNMNIISDNIVQNNNLSGIAIDNCDNNIFLNNTITEVDTGFMIDRSENNTILGNRISSHWYGEGINFNDNCNNNIVTCNEISSNYYGIWSQGSINLVYHNNFINNTINAHVLDSHNIWDNGYPSGGNYWDDYNGTDSDGDGIGDTPYNISDGSNQDHYPLMNPITTPPLFVWVDDDFNTSTPSWNITHFDVIQDGIDAVAEGGTVYVYNGTYYEMVVITKDGINLIGEDKNTTIIDGGGVHVSADWVNISNLNIKNGCADNIVTTYAKNCSITRNIIYNSCDYGITFYRSDGNIATGNTISNCDWGIFLNNGHNNIITQNTISSNNDYGIWLYDFCSNNMIYHNNFLNNTQNAIEQYWWFNTWDNDYPSGGNYWHDYIGVDNYHGPNQDIPGSDGIGDTPYHISGGSNEDNYPLMNPYGWLIELHVNQSTFNRGFPIRHAIDGDWGGAQSFTPTLDTLSYVELYLRKFGTPGFNLTVELREDSPEGTLLDTVVFEPSEVASGWTWLNINFDDVTVTPGTDYLIVVQPPPSGVTTSFGYEWGYAFGDQYWPGSFWFTRDGGGLWRDLPTMYEFVFKTYGY